MTEKRFVWKEEINVGYVNEFVYDIKNEKELDEEDMCDLLNILHEKNQSLKSDLARVIEQAKKNNELLVDDIRILEKELWCKECANNYGRLRELKKEFLKYG